MKRKRGAHVGDRPPKRPDNLNVSSQSALATTSHVEHPVLQRLYPNVFSLRHYVLSRLPGSSRNRRRKISQLGQPACGGVDDELARLLDSTLVGVSPKALANLSNRDEAAEAIHAEVVNFSQQLPDCATGSTFKPGYFMQSEIVDFVIWLLFKRSPSHRPSHLLCHGFQRSSTHQHGLQHCAARCITGVASYSPNTYVDILKGPLWCRLHSLLGPGGDAIMAELLVDCGIFYRVEEGPNNYYQISGTPLSEVKAAGPVVDPNLSTREAALSSEDRKPSSITFVRSRMFYARAALNAKGGVRFGMRHIHVLNRFPHLDNHEETVQIMRYIFPRQFGLHNVFTSKVDIRDTAMTFKDYTLREKEISQALDREISKKGATETQAIKLKSRLPARLRGQAVALVERLRRLNQKCSYVELLRHHCPVEGLDLSPYPEWRKKALQPRRNVPAGAKPAPHDKENTSNAERRTVEQTSFTDRACPPAHVSAFCRAVIARVIPNGFWGDENNRRTIMYWVDQFICLRRFESVTLHQVIQKVQISSLAWLRPPGQHTPSKMAKTDSDKRQEIFLEFVYWMFDSFLVPLIRSNFHVTESNVHRNRLFYFRHDVWRMLTGPPLSNLKVDMFEELPTERATKLLSHRPIGFSKIRLLPKHEGVRMITNLKRRQQVIRNGTMMLGRSINSVMAPVFHAINFEKSLHPDKFGSSLFSVGDIFPRLASFKRSLLEQSLSDRPLYFAKVDVQSCFDTIPQERLLTMVEGLLTLQTYQTGKHVEMSPLGPLQRLQGDHVNPLPLKRYVPHTKGSKVPGEFAAFGRLVHDEFVKNKANTVFVDTAIQQLETKDNLMHLLREHVERNLVKIGKRFYRQKTGIPQGSILSSILCNFFYAELEREVLGFVLGPESLLLRLLDDFCLITAQREHAERFVRILHRGHPDYGVVVKREKSLTNFDVTTEDGHLVPQCVSGAKFPYCGVLIDTQTLEVSKDAERTSRENIVDSLTVDLAKVPGQSFHRKTLNAFKIQLQAMFIDTSLNTVETVLGNLHQSFHEVAVRCFEYTKSLNKLRPTHSRLLIKTVESLVGLAYVMLQRRTRSKGRQNVERIRSIISRGQMHWLACKGFETAFQRRQTQHGALLTWIRRSLGAHRPRCRAERRMLESALAWRARRSGTAGA